MRWEKIGKIEIFAGKIARDGEDDFQELIRKKLEWNKQIKET